MEKKMVKKIKPEEIKDSVDAKLNQIRGLFKSYMLSPNVRRTERKENGKVHYVIKQSPASLLLAQRLQLVPWPFLPQYNVQQLKRSIEFRTKCLIELENVEMKTQEQLDRIEFTKIQLTELKVQLYHAVNWQKINDMRAERERELVKNKL